MAARSGDPSNPTLPRHVAALLWDYDPLSIDPERHRDALFARVLSRGDWRSIVWVRGRFGDAAIREWLVRTRGRQLDRRTVRLWQVLLELPGDQVDAWLAAPERQLWDRRARA
jgi:hypothetical protein